MTMEKLCLMLRNKSVLVYSNQKIRGRGDILHADDYLFECRSDVAFRWIDVVPLN